MIFLYKALKSNLSAFKSLFSLVLFNFNCFLVSLQDRKRQCEFSKMTQKHEKHENVLRRKMEEVRNVGLFACLVHTLYLNSNTLLLPKQVPWIKYV